jgi:ribonuclease HII
MPSLDHERECWRAGAEWVIGVDEVGVGPLAGPVTAAAVAVRDGAPFGWFDQVRDSKQLGTRTREMLSEAVMNDVPSAIGWVGPEEIDRFGIAAARRIAVLRALDGLGLPRDAVITDALAIPVPGNIPIVRADALCVSVAAASIVAKVARDALMVELCDRYPGYGFCRHKGYGTALHREALARLGPSSIHRRSYAPVAALCRPW